MQIDIYCIFYYLFVNYDCSHTIDELRPVLELNANPLHYSTIFDKISSSFSTIIALLNQFTNEFTDKRCSDLQQLKLPENCRNIITCLYSKRDVGRRNQQIITSLINSNCSKTVSY